MRDLIAPARKGNMRRFDGGAFLAAALGGSISCEQQNYEETKKFNQSSSLHHGDNHAKPDAAHPEVTTDPHAPVKKADAPH